MAAYSGKSKRIKNALKAVLSAITLDAGAGAEPAFVQVLDSTSGEFDGYPSLRLLPDDMSTQKAAVSTNDRSVRFIARVHLNMESKPESQSETFDQMYDLTDLIIDTLDEGDYQGALTTQDPTLGTWIMNATRGDWSVVSSSAGTTIMCDVNVEVKYSKDLN